MKKIVINGRFLVHRVTGVERYAREILNELDKIVEPNVLEIAVPPEVEKLPFYQNIKVKRVGKLHNRAWEHISFPLYVMKKNAISLNLCNVAPLIEPGIICIHDVKIKATPQYFSKKFLMWYNLLFNNAMKRSKKIITVSEFSKSEIVKYYDVNPDKITVIPNAWQHFKRIGYDEQALEKYGLEKNKYFFSMCSLEPNKNFKWIAEVAKRNPNETFAVSGSVNRTVFADALDFEQLENVKLLGYVSDAESKTLMQDCKVFLFPTFYEGFGIPPLEAISAGAKSVVVSDTEVMHEIFGDIVIYIDPNEYEIDIETKLSDFAALPNETILEKYSWKNSALMLLYLMASV